MLAIVLPIVLIKKDDKPTPGPEPGPTPVTPIDNYNPYTFDKSALVDSTYAYTGIIETT